MPSEKQDTFDEIIRPRLRWNPKGSIAQMLMDHVFQGIVPPYYQEVRLEKYRRIQFGFVDDVNLNAFATLPDVIAVNSGALAILIAMYQCILASPKILPWIGDPEKEVTPSPISWAGFVAPAIMPNDPIRRAYALFLVVMAFDFMVRHELAHLRNGHVDLLNAEAGLSMLLEISDDTSIISALDFQTMEMDADCYAAREGFKWFTSRQIELHASSKMIVAGGANRETMYLWVFAIHAFFLAFYEAASAVSEIGARRHPPSNMRQVIVNSTLLQILNHPLKNILLEVAGPAVGDSSRAFSMIHGRSVDASYAVTAISDGYQEHSQQMLTNWSDLRPRLLPFARGGPLTEASGINEQKSAG